MFEMCLFMDTVVNPPVQFDVYEIHLFLFAFVDHRVFAFQVETDLDGYLFQDLFQSRKRTLN